MSETKITYKSISPHEALTDQIKNYTVDDKKVFLDEKGNIHPGVQKYLDALPAEYKTARNIAESDLKSAGEQLLEAHEVGLHAAKANMGPEVITFLDNFHGMHTLTTSQQVQEEITKALGNEKAGQYLADARHSAKIKELFANVLPKDQTITVDEVRNYAEKIKSSAANATTDEQIISAFANPLHELHADKIKALKVVETAASAASTPTSGGATAPETGFVATKKKVGELIDSNLSGKAAEQHKEQLKKSFAEVFKGHDKLEVDEAKVTDAIKKFADNFRDDKVIEGAETKLKDGTLHEEFLKSVKDAVKPETLNKDTKLESFDAAITKQKEMLNRNLFKRLISSDSYGTGAIANDWKKGADGKRATGKLAMRGLGTVTGVGLIISGFGDFKGREANDNSGQVESHPLTGLMKTVTGAGLVGISTLYKGVSGGRAVA